MRLRRRRTRLAVTILVLGTSLGALVVAAHHAWPSKTSPASSGDATRSATPAVLHASTPVSPSPHAAPMAFARSQQPLDTLPTEVLALKNAQLDPRSSRLVATWHAEGGGRAFLVRTVSGDTCIVLARLNETGAEGCNPGSDPFAGRPYFWTSSAEGGPGLSDLRAYELVGIVRDDVARVELSDTAGMVHQAQIGSDRGFAFVFRRAALIAGDSQVRIAAYSNDGTLLGRETVRGD